MGARSEPTPGRCRLETDTLHERSDLTIKGYFEAGSPNVVSGWVWDSDAPSRRLLVEVWAGETTLGQLIADRYRADLEEAGIGDACYAFRYELPSSLHINGQNIFVVVAGTDYRLQLSAPTPRYEDSDRDKLFAPVEPWPLVPREQCHFYHCFNFPDGETVEDASWDLRGQFERYIGGYPIRGKTVLDVGTATGFLAFSAEESGAARVTAFDGLHARDFERTPIKGSTFTDDRLRCIAEVEAGFQGMKNGFWYAWHKKKSKVEVVYAPVTQLWRWNRKFDVVIAGAVVEHLSDPVPFIGALAGLANEAVILAATQVVESDQQIMQTLTPWDSPLNNYAWWILSRGLYERIFKNLGFSVEYTTCISKSNVPWIPGSLEKPTIIARRIHGNDRAGSTALTGAGEGAAHPAKRDPVASAQLLLALDGEEFIHVAYATILNRAPDASGLANYLGELDGGVSKTAIISQLRNSAEGRRQDLPLIGYRRALMWSFLRRVLTAGMSKN